MFKEGQSSESDSLANDAGARVEGDLISESAEVNPERKVVGMMDNALSILEKAEEGFDGENTPEAQSWGKKAKEFFKTDTGENIKNVGLATGIVTGGLLLYALKDVYIIYKVFKQIATGGKLDYAFGKKVVEDAVSLLSEKKK